MSKITPITLALPWRLGRVNCYLVENASGYVLIDTGSANQRADLEKTLTSAGCRPGNLKLIILTHGDFDHSGNAAYLCKTFGAPLAMHHDDSAMLEQGNMFHNRRKPNVFIKLLKPLIPRMFGFGQAQRCSPDFYLADGDALSEHGFDAQVVSLPGHSKGSIGILSAAGDLFCGDLLENTRQPALGSLIDDAAAAAASVQKLGKMVVKTVYPGHGEPFPMSSWRQNQA